MGDKDPLADIRQRIDEIDMAVQQLVSERAECARKVAEVKREQGDTDLTDARNRHQDHRCGNGQDGRREDALKQADAGMLRPRPQMIGDIEVIACGNFIVDIPR